LLDQENGKLFREVAGFSEATYARYASRSEVYRQALDITRLWAKRNPEKS